MSPATILVVDDEPGLRALAREILEDEGYRVLDSHGAHDAIEVARAHPEVIHLLVTDLVLPQMNGRVLAETLMIARPGLKVLYMSGYTENAVVHHGRLDRGVHLLGKPFRLADLARNVREVLDQG